MKNNQVKLYEIVIGSVQPPLNHHLQVEDCFFALVACGGGSRLKRPLGATSITSECPSEKSCWLSPDGGSSAVVVVKGWLYDHWRDKLRKLWLSMRVGAPFCAGSPIFSHQWKTINQSRALVTHSVGMCWVVLFISIYTKSGRNRKKGKTVTCFVLLNSVSKLDEPF